MELAEGNIELRTIRYEDKHKLATLANNKKIWIALRDSFPLPYTTGDAERFIDMTKNNDSLISFAITLDYGFCGVISLSLQQDIYAKNAEIGYWLGEPYWNKGIMTKAVKLMTRYAFEKLNLERVYASVFQGNEASICVLEKCGYRLEGQFRNAVFKNNILIDELRFARLRGD